MIDDPPANESAPRDIPESIDSTLLDHVVDDLGPKLAWSEWAVEEMIKGRSPEELSAELTAAGWSQDDAAELVETARRRTRRLRGVITRDDVARENASRYHKATALSWFTAFLSLASAWRLLNSLAFVLGSRKSRPTQPAQPRLEPLSSAENASQPDGARPAKPGSLAHGGPK
jgi:hypothetical protein